jgi:hypothetical protein
MKKIITLLAASMLSVSAFAGGSFLGDTTTATAIANPIANATSVSNATAVGHASAVVGVVTNQDQVQGQLQGQQQGQSQTSKQANTQSMTYNESSNVHYSGKYTVKTNAAVFAPNAYASSPCRIGLSAGVSVVGLGLSGGGSVEDEGCTMRENARILNSLGANEAALLLMCSDANVARVLSICPQPAAE